MTPPSPVLSTPALDRVWRRGKEFLGSELPVMCGAMTWISDPQLVSLMSNLGAFGVLAAGNMPPEVFAQYVDDTRARTSRPFAGNVITIAPNYLSHLEILCERKVSHIVFAGSIPRASEVQRAKDSGAKVLCFASTGSIAERMIDYGTDALILEGNEAGGHIGHVSTVVLLQEILFNFPTVPIFVAGGIATGKMIAHLVLMGAAGAQMGTRFVMAEECAAHPKFKEVFIRARAAKRSRLPSTAPSFRSFRCARSTTTRWSISATSNWSCWRCCARAGSDRQEAQFKVEEYWVGSLRRAAVDGDVEDGSLMAGQSVGMVDRVQPLREILEELVADADAALQEARRRLDG